MLTRRTLFAATAATLATPSLLARAPDPIFDLQERTFRFFWDTTDVRTGLAPDRWPTPSFASIAAIGFALTAYPIGVVNGWVDRAAARDRTVTTLRFLWSLPQGPAATGVAGHRGFFYHFLDMARGYRFAHCELSTIDTALLMAGVLFAGTWFDRANPIEAEIRSLAERLYARVDWRWAQDRSDDSRLSMGWHPESGFIARRWNGYTEAMLLYVLALGSPTHAIEPEAWTAWCASYPDSWRGEGEERHLAGAPHFWHQYSHVWIDFRGTRDAAMRKAGFDYFENSRRATIAQRDYAIRNPGGWVGYGANVWGLTACDGPGDLMAMINGNERQIGAYSARGPTGFPDGRDDGTIAPTAAAASLPFAPELAERALADMRHRYGAAVWSRYGFVDSFNPTLSDPRVPVRKGRIHAGVGWIDDDYLGIDQGPIVAMIENHRSTLIWSTMRRSASIRLGLQRAGFAGGWID
jgi:hypothetical protein